MNPKGRCITQHFTTNFAIESILQSETLGFFVALASAVMIVKCRDVLKSPITVGTFELSLRFVLCRVTVLVF